MSGGREIAQAERAFLLALHRSVKKYFDEGLTDFEMKEKVMNDLSAYDKWVGFNGMGRVISAAYRQIDIESF